ncbi:MAG: hypothetical protein OEY93_10305 [Anaerolineae bacterium]|nr:hypothetical protein [Anaerolineae bacterium]
MDIRQHTLNADPQGARLILAELLDAYLDPAFGALPKKEIDLIIMRALESLHFIDHDPDLYQLVTRLRVTRAKARNLLYEQELRRLSQGDLEKRVRETLKRPILQKQGELFLLEIENPLVGDHLKSKIQKLGYASDGSFNPGLIKLPLKAITALIEGIYKEDKKDIKAIQAALIKAGAPDTTVRGVIKAAIKAVARKFAEETGEVLVDSVGEYMGPIVDGALESAAEKFSELFAVDEEG